MPAPQPLRAAILSSDPALRETVRHAAGNIVRVEMEIEAPYSRLSDANVRELRKLAPDLVLLDLSRESDLGLHLAATLVESAPKVRLLGFGPAPAPEFLLQAMRVGISEYLTPPHDVETVRATLERVYQKLGHGADLQQQPGRSFAFFGAKGGTGVTTTAVNFAILAYQITSRSTLLLDLDPHLGEAALALGLRPRYTFLDVVQNFHRLDGELLESYVEHHSSGVHLLSAPFHPEKALTVTPDQVRRLLLFLRDHYEQIVVDVTAFSPTALAVFESADQLFMMTTVDLPSLRNVQRFLPLLRQRMRNWDEQFRLVVNRQSQQDPISVAEIERSVGTTVFWRLANEYQPVAHALNTGKPVVLNGSSRYSRDLREMTAAVLDSPAQDGVKRRQDRPSLVHRLGSLMRRKDTTRGNAD